MPCFAPTRKESTGIQMQMPTTHNTNANNTQIQMKTSGKSWTGKFPPRMDGRAKKWREVAQGGIGSYSDSNLPEDSSANIC